MGTENKIVCSMQDDSADFGLAELRAVDKSAKLLKWLSPGIGLVQLNMEFKTFSAQLLESMPIFLQHLFPVTFELNLDDHSAHSHEIVESAVKMIQKYIEFIEQKKTFSVQTRILGKNSTDLKAFSFNTAIADCIAKTGAVLDVVNPQQVISIIVAHNSLYAGISLTHENLSDWSCGKVRLARMPGQLSRAEFKLIEAIKVFQISLPAQGLALDLGAAPGGWTRILRQNHMKVVAVDPANLHPQLAKDTGVTHCRQTAQAYLSCKRKFDLVVNDMKISPKETAELMLLAQKSLVKGGLAIVTLKLPSRNQVKIVKEALKILAEGYQILKVRQLFHNRSEVTVILKKGE